ncbi:MAG: AarF/ABC1/UbiB kinase family protein [Ilumatobacteraceae bacterium]|nr:AarF/ABC1/UbiB kinase family protein [Ilumatobacteraceae bacterium]
MSSSWCRVPYGRDVPVPPLPDMTELLDRSERFAAHPGLRDSARLWLAWGPPARRRVADEAALLARASLRPTTLRAVGRTGVDLAKGVAPGLREDALRRMKEGPLETGTALRHLQELVKAGGPTYIKLGQFVATAQGLLPDEWVDAFGWCRDTATPLPYGLAEQTFEDRFQVPLDAVFSAFDPQPLGSASIGQVHAATLHDRTEVVVKVRRPGLREQFERDLRSMALAAAAGERASKSARVANLSGFVELFAQMVLEEIDFRFEALNQVELSLASEAAGHDFTIFPRPIPHLTTEDVLVMTRVEGVPYNRALETYPDAVDGERLLNLAITGTLEHMVAYGIFHGDLHAGNVLINADGDFSLIDFGIAGRVTAEQRAATVQFLFGFGRNDNLMQIKGLQAFGAVPADADLPALVAQIEQELNAVDPTLLSREGEFTVDKLGQALGSIIKVLARNGFSLPKELVLFFKNLLYLNGFAATLAPETNLFDNIDPTFVYFVGKYPTELGEIMNDLI